MKDVDQGSTSCNYSESSTNKTWLVDTWDGGQICLPGCLSRMNENNWEKACCAARPSGVKLETICIISDVAGVVKPGADDSKAVQCKGTLKCFQYRTLKILSSGLTHFLNITLFY